MARLTKLEAFQPSQRNSRRLAAVSKVRGAKTQLCNRALDSYFSKAKNPGAVELLRKFVQGYERGIGVSAADFNLARQIVKG